MKSLLIEMKSTKIKNDP